MEEFQIPTKVFSGVDSLDWLKRLRNKHILMVCDSFLPGTPTLKGIRQRIDQSNQVSVFSDVKPDPPLDSIMAGVSQFNEVKPDVMIGIGGGSAIDTGKAIRFFGEKINHSHLENFVAIPTTSGTGSEVTNIAVVSDTKNKTKVPLSEQYLTPDVALLDPQLVMTAPKSVTAYSGLDVLTHSLEALVSKGANTITDALAEKGIDVITHDLVDCYKHGDDVEKRKTIHEISCGAGMAFTNAGLGFCHAMAHQLGANFHVPHGLACAMLLPHVVAYNAKHSDLALHKYAAAIRKAGLASHGLSDRLTIQRLLSRIRQMMIQMDCPQTLRAFGVDVKDAEAKTQVVIEDAKLDATFPGNPVIPSDDDLKAIYRKVIR
ncbi:1-propanol dehydrogenase PduQ [Levilactobacillus angrenensis]|uniref:1-propanol dehydrogenase PduQ n=1 Tax=Levilactobacillus angrenensis TaxID=2486020 RepID=A0ABW1UE76_9LACO|nr:1-propanol dehydrogenase PduQ [Levilactobacillus angrenensis]